MNYVSFPKLCHIFFVSCCTGDWLKEINRKEVTWDNVDAILGEIRVSYSNAYLSNNKASLMLLMKCKLANES